MGVRLHARSLQHIASQYVKQCYPGRVNAGFKSTSTYTVNTYNSVHGGTYINQYATPRGITTTTASDIPTYACEKSAVQTVYDSSASPANERAFYVNDVGVVSRQYERWCDELPNVHPFYAVKCNPDVTLLRHLHNHGTGFDCASAAEMKQCLDIGVKAEDIIFANPIKSINDLRFAHANGVKKMTFDNIDELHKISQLCPNAEVVLRLLPDDSGSVMRFGSKFGAPAEHIDTLLKTTKQLGLKLTGVSFHIGSGCFDPLKYDSAIKLARATFDRAVDLGLPKLKLLDLGGGFPGAPVGVANADESPQFEQFTEVIRASLNRYFGDAREAGVRIIAEPGRYMATAWSTLFTLVQGKRAVPINHQQSERKFLYYINDGVYGSFNCLMFDHAKANPIPAWRLWNNKLSLEQVAANNKAVKMASTPRSQSMYMNLYTAYDSAASSEPRYAQQRMLHTDVAEPVLTKGTFFGPTCDSMDCIATDYPIEELQVGDWVAFEHYGAYTNAAATTFNGMPKPVINYVNSKVASPTVA